MGDSHTEEAGEPSMKGKKGRGPACFFKGWALRKAPRSPPGEAWEAGGSLAPLYAGGLMASSATASVLPLPQPHLGPACASHFAQLGKQPTLFPGGPVTHLPGCPPLGWWAGPAGWGLPVGERSGWVGLQVCLGSGQPKGVPRCVKGLCSNNPGRRL